MKNDMKIPFCMALKKGKLVQCGADKLDIFIQWIITSININQVKIYKNI